MYLESVAYTISTAVERFFMVVKLFAQWTFLTRELSYMLFMFVYSFMLLHGLNKEHG